MSPTVDLSDLATPPRHSAPTASESNRGASRPAGSRSPGGRRVSGAVLGSWAAATILLSTAAQAQTSTPPPPREGSAEFALVGTTGNASTQSLGLGGELTYRPGPWETQFKANYVRNESENALKAEAYRFSTRAGLTLTPRLSGFGRYGYLRDRFAGISHRNTVEGGLAYVLADRAPQKVVGDLSLGYARERRLLGRDLSTATASLGVIYTVQVSEASEVRLDPHFVLSLSRSADWRFDNLVAITTKLTSVLSLKVSNTLRHLNLPVEGFQTTDTITAIALVAEF